MSDDPAGRIVELLIALQVGQGSIMERLDRQEQRFERFEERQNRLEEQQNRLEEQQKRLRVDLMARMDRLQDALTLHKEEVTTSMGAGERAERIASAMQDVVRQLTEQVTVMVRQIRRLQEDVQELKGGSNNGGKTEP